MKFTDKFKYAISVFYTIAGYVLSVPVVINYFLPPEWRWFTAGEVIPAIFTMAILLVLGAMARGDDISIQIKETEDD